MEPNYYWLWYRLHLCLKSKQNVIRYATEVTEVTDFQDVKDATGAMKRVTLAAGAGTLTVAAAISISGCALVQAQPPTAEAPQLPATSSVVAKLDTVENPHLSADVRGREVSGEGPAPQKLDPRGVPPELTITNNVIDVAPDGPNRISVTRSIRYVLPNGNVVETEPAKVPFVLESDGEWRIDRIYLCEPVMAMQSIIRESGRDVKPDPGCA